MIQRSKVETFIGFSIKAHALICGTNSVMSLKKAGVVIIDCAATENTLKQAIKCANRFGCPLVMSKLPIEDIVGKENCKLIAITDSGLANAVLTNLDEDFSIYSGGNGR